jgi:hypothetical protein
MENFMFWFQDLKYVQLAKNAIFGVLTLVTVQSAAL